jgi:triacylglycerol esterase/lipase EstA (alpha/beta hydrolase family)
LTVFVHGFQGSEFDLELVKNYIQAYYRECTCLMINSLEDETSGNIETLGEKFAQEVERFIQRSAFEYKRINFVGYSLGGVIIRAGMRHLAAYKDKVNLLITLASPHLGIHRMDNFLVSAGVWYMIKFDKVRSLNELNYTDDDNVLLKLSKDESLGWFNKIIVASSKEDNFVPNYSARIEPHDKDPLAQ